MNVICHWIFVQAEDGIRDGTVTGVQTCALPISAGCVLQPAFWRSYGPVVTFNGSSFTPGRQRCRLYAVLAMARCCLTRCDGHAGHCFGACSCCYQPLSVTPR